MKTVKSWRKANDADVLTYWHQTCKCRNTKTIVRVEVSNLVNAGFPICQECGDEYRYMHVEVRR